MKDNIKTGKQPSAKKEGSLLATVLIGVLLVLHLHGYSVSKIFPIAYFFISY